MKKAIGTQLRVAFFLPLVVAYIHTLVAYPAIKRALLVFAIGNTKLIFTCLVVAMCVYGALYYGMYKITARVYYKIVKWTAD